MRLILTLLITVCTIYSPAASAQTRTLGGFGIGHILSPQDNDFTVHNKNIHIPLLAYDFKYSTIAIPIVIQELSSISRFGFGLVGYSSIHQNQPSRMLSTSQKEVLIHELSTTVFYLEYILSRPILWKFRGSIFAGATLAESVLTQATELYSVDDDGQGGVKETFSGVSKAYEIDYGIGFTLGTGVNYNISENYEIDLIARYLYAETDLEPIEGDKVYSGSVQVQVVFLTRFD